VITGAASGIGYAGAAELLRRGAIPVLTDCDAEPLAQQTRRLGADLTHWTLDVTDASQCDAVMQAVLARHGRIDGVWANAGVASFGPLAHTDLEAWARCIQVNLLGSLYTVRAALPALIASRGLIAVSASVSSFAHPPAMSAYAASKAGLEAACNAWRIELAAQGVAVCVIHASWVRTALVDEGALHPGFVRLHQTAPAPLRRMLAPEEAARRMVDGLERRQRRIFVPGWVALLHWWRGVLHEAWAERALRRAAPEIEAHYLAGMNQAGRLASSFGPRELARAQARGLRITLPESEYAASDCPPRVECESAAPPDPSRR
jgi:NAD(P)-dependent dehydrogenase (short-subunit alcohol dehydrogenase family)